MPERNYTAKELCLAPRCSNEARYTTMAGDRLCSLHASGRLAVRDADLPRLIELTNVLLLDVTAGRTALPPLLQELRSIIGRTST